MGSTPEAAVKKKIRQILDSAGAYYAMPVGSAYGKSGVPDFLVCYRGKFIGIEAKAGKNTTTALQDRELATIVQAGGVALIVNENDLGQLQEVFNATT